MNTNDLSYLLEGWEVVQGGWEESHVECDTRIIFTCTLLRGIDDFNLSFEAWIVFLPVRCCGIYNNTIEIIKFSVAHGCFSQLCIMMIRFLISLLSTLHFFVSSIGTGSTTWCWKICDISVKFSIKRLLIFWALRSSSSGFFILIHHDLLRNNINYYNSLFILHLIWHNQMIIQANTPKIHKVRWNIKLSNKSWTLVFARWEFRIWANSKATRKLKYLHKLFCIYCLKLCTISFL